MGVFPKENYNSTTNLKKTLKSFLFLKVMYNTIYIYILNQLRGRGREERRGERKREKKGVVMRDWKNQFHFLIQVHF